MYIYISIYTHTYICIYTHIYRYLLVQRAPKAKRETVNPKHICIHIYIYANPKPEALYTYIYIHMYMNMAEVIIILGTPLIFIAAWILLQTARVEGLGFGV